METGGLQPRRISARTLETFLVEWKQVLAEEWFSRRYAPLKPS